MILTDLDDLFAPLERLDRFVIGQLGQSLDGRIATVSGHSHYINGPEDIERLHRLRALVDAVVVGAGALAVVVPAHGAPAHAVVSAHKRVRAAPGGRCEEVRTVCTSAEWSYPPRTAVHFSY